MLMKSMRMVLIASAIALTGVAQAAEVKILGPTRLRVDTRKWYMSKVLPKFADRTILEGGDKPLEAREMSPVEAARRMNIPFQRLNAIICPLHSMPSLIEHCLDYLEVNQIILSNQYL